MTKQDTVDSEQDPAIKDTPNGQDGGISNNTNKPTTAIPDPARQQRPIKQFAPPKRAFAKNPKYPASRPQVPWYGGVATSSSGITRPPVPWCRGVGASSASSRTKNDQLSNFQFERKPAMDYRSEPAMELDLHTLAQPKQYVTDAQTELSNTAPVLAAKLIFDGGRESASSPTLPGMKLVGLEESTSTGQTKETLKRVSQSATKIGTPSPQEPKLAKVDKGLVQNQQFESPTVVPPEDDFVERDILPVHDVKEPINRCVSHPSKISISDCDRLTPMKMDTLTGAAQQNIASKRNESCSSLSSPEHSLRSLDHVDENKAIQVSLRMSALLPQSPSAASSPTPVVDDDANQMPTSPASPTVPILQETDIPVSVDNTVRRYKGSSTISGQIGDRRSTVQKLRPPTPALLNRPKANLATVCSPYLAAPAKNTCRSRRNPLPPLNLSVVVDSQDRTCRQSLIPPASPKLPLPLVQNRTRPKTATRQNTTPAGIPWMISQSISIHHAVGENSPYFQALQNRIRQHQTQPLHFPAPTAQTRQNRDPPRSFDLPMLNVTNQNTTPQAAQHLDVILQGMQGRVSQNEHPPAGPSLPMIQSKDSQNVTPPNSSHIPLPVRRNTDVQNETRPVIQGRTSQKAASNIPVLQRRIMKNLLIVSPFKPAAFNTACQISSLPVVPLVQNNGGGQDATSPLRSPLPALAQDTPSQTSPASPHLTVKGKANPIAATLASHSVHVQDIACHQESTTLPNSTKMNVPDIVCQKAAPEAFPHVKFQDRASHSAATLVSRQEPLQDRASQNATTFASPHVQLQDTAHQNTASLACPYVEFPTRPVVNRTPHLVEDMTLSPVAHMTQNSPVDRSPSPVEDMTPCSVVDQTPSPVLNRTASPVMDRTPSPIVDRIPSPVLDKAQSPSLDSSPNLAADRTPSRAADKTPIPTVVEKTQSPVSTNRTPKQEADMIPSPIVSERTHSPVLDRPANQVVDRTPSPSVDSTPSLVADMTPSPKLGKAHSPSLDRPPNQVVDRTPSPSVDSAPSLVADMTPSPKLGKAHSPSLDRPPNQVADRTPSPVMTMTASRIVDGTLSPIVTSIVSPVVDRTPSPILDRTKTPVLNRSPSTVANRTSSPLVDTISSSELDQTQVPVVVDRHDRVLHAVIARPSLRTTLNKKKANVFYNFPETYEEFVEDLPRNEDLPKPRPDSSVKASANQLRLESPSFTYYAFEADIDSFGVSKAPRPQPGPAHIPRRIERPALSELRKVPAIFINGKRESQLVKCGKELPESVCLREESWSIQSYQSVLELARLRKTHVPAMVKDYEENYGEDFGERVTPSFVEMFERAIYAGRLPTVMEASESKDDDPLSYSAVRFDEFAQHIDGQTLPDNGVKAVGDSKAAEDQNAVDLQTRARDEEMTSTEDTDDDDDDDDDDTPQFIFKHRHLIPVQRPSSEEIARRCTSVYPVTKFEPHFEHSHRKMFLKMKNCRRISFPECPGLAPLRGNPYVGAYTCEDRGELYDQQQKPPKDGYQVRFPAYRCRCQSHLAT